MATPRPLAVRSNSPWPRTNRVRCSSALPRPCTWSVSTSPRLRTTSVPTPPTGGNARTWPRAGRREPPPGSPATSSVIGPSGTVGWRERGWVLIIRAFSEPDAQVREALLREAIAIGRRFGDPDIEFLALAYLGGVFVMTDRVEEGMVLGDEALAALCAGELTELASVDEIFCGLFWACELVNDVPRADQWMRAAADRTT